MSQNRGFLHKTGIYFRPGTTYSPSDTIALALASTATIVIEFSAVDSVALALASTATQVIELRPAGSIAIALDSTSTLSGGIFSTFSSIALALVSSAAATGVLYEPADDMAIALASVSDIRIVWSPADTIALALASSASAVGLRYEPADTLALALGSVANITFGNIVYKWSTEHIEALTTHPYPTVYVDLNSDTAPTGAFPTGSIYERRLLQLPRLEEINLDSRSGVSGFQKVSLVVDNSDGLLNGVEMQNTFGRMILVSADGTAFREFKGLVTDFSFGHQTIINVEDIDAQAFTSDLPKRTLNDVVELEKIADGGFAPNVIADNLGRPITIAFGRNVKLPTLYIKADEAAREYDYIIGEGTGLNGNNWSEVFTVYRKLKAMDNISGTAQSDTSTTITLETADVKPSSWYKYFWIEITAGTGVGQIRYVTAYDEDTNRCTVDSAWTTGLDGTSVYQLTEWRFYDGSQANPYAGMALLRFKKRMGVKGSTDDIFVDCDALQDEVDRARAIQSVLTNTVWGLGLSVDTTSFDAASTAISALDSFTCEGNIPKVVSAITVLSKLLSFRDMVLGKEDAITIRVDATKTSAFNFGLGDGLGFTKITNPNPQIQNLHPNSITKDLKLRYRKNNSLSDVYLYEFARASSAIGVDEVLDAPFIYAHETADKFLDYKRKRFALATKTLSLDVGQDGQGAERGDLVTVVIPSLALNSDWEVTKSNVTIAGVSSLALIPFTSNPYSYVTFVSEGGTLPIDESFDIQPDYDITNPDPVSNLSVSMLLNTSGVTDLPYATLSWTEPEDNYGGAIVSRKLTTDSDTAYMDIGTFETTAVDSNLVAGLRYDYRVVSLNNNGDPEFKGLAVFDLSNLALGDVTNPNPISGLSFLGSMLGELSWEFNPSTSADVRRYEYEIDDFSSFSTPLREGTIEDTQIKYSGDLSGGLASGVTRWCRVRTEDWSGLFSAWSSGVSGSTAPIVQGDITDNEITNKNSAFVSSVTFVAAGSQVLISTSITKRSGTKIRIEVGFKMDATGDPTHGFAANLKRGASFIQTAWVREWHTTFPGQAEYSVAAVFDDNISSSGTFTYALTLSSATLGITARAMTMRVLELRR